MLARAAVRLRRFGLSFSRFFLQTVLGSFPPNPTRRGPTSLLLTAWAESQSTSTTPRRASHFLLIGFCPFPSFSQFRGKADSRASRARSLAPGPCPCCRGWRRRRAVPQRRFPSTHLIPQAPLPPPCNVAAPAGEPLTGVRPGPLSARGQGLSFSRIV